MTVAHLTTVHARFDTRIYLKQCRGLARAGHQVILIVADGRGNERKDGIEIVDVGCSYGRLRRMIAATRRVLAAARKADASLYQIHDPELLPIGQTLRGAGKRVIFDAHEDLPKQLLGKPYLHPAVRRVLARCLSIYEGSVCFKMSGIIAATPSIREKFLKINPRTIDINNFPLLGELDSAEIDWSAKRAEVAYVGGISRSRGILEAVRAIAHLQSDARLQLIGLFSDSGDEEQARGLAGWTKVDRLGFLNRLEVKNALKRAVAGLVTFLPLPNHIDAQPNKMFEYMSAGLPVIGSNFPLWRDIIEGNQCGICVDPLNPREIAHAIDYLVTHPSQAEQMGRNGQRAVKKYYNWSIEEKKYIKFIEEI